MGGTTDITRTIALGPLTDTEKKHYTAVSKATSTLARRNFLAVRADLISMRLQDGRYGKSAVTTITVQGTVSAICSMFTKVQTR